MGTNTKLAKWGARVALASLAALIASAFVPGAAFAQEAAAAAEPPPDVGAGLDLLWTVLAAILVFFMDLLVKLKPSTAKGNYVRSVTVSTTHGPGIKLDTTQFS